MRRTAPFLLFLCVVSCEKNKYGENPPYPVSGRVLVNGKAAQRVVLVFHLAGNNDEKCIMPEGVTDAEGRFFLSTYGNKDGAPAGDYYITAIWKPSGGGIRNREDRLDGKYADPQSSGLTAHIERGKNELKPFELQAELAETTPPQGAAKWVKH
jgi:hypothetical protein